MKKLLALVLALVMTMSLAVSANAAFTDADKINESYAEAANVLTGMGVLKGYTDGSFKPEGAITRAEVAAVVYRIYTADVTDKNVGLYTGYGKFNDLAGANWAKGYIGYCANAGLVRGYNDTTFGPLDNVTGYQALAMILRAMGYDKNGEFAGKDWQLHVAQTAQQLGILKNAGSENLAAPASRQLVAELLFQAIQKPCVSYTPAFGYVPTTVVGVQQSLGVKNFTLTLKEGTQDVWGRPSHTWTYTTGNTKTVVAQKADAVYYTKVDECDIAKDLGISSAKAIESAWIDGVKTNVTLAAVTTDCNGKIDPLNTTSLVGAQGRITEVYEMTNGYRLVEINTYLGKVTKVIAATTDRNGHTTPASIEVEFYSAPVAKEQNTFVYTVMEGDYEATGFTVGQYVLVKATLDKKNAAGQIIPAIQEVTAATVTPMGLVKTWTTGYGTVAPTTTVVETKYNDADKFYLGNYKQISPASYAGQAYDTIVDAYGNLIGLVPSTVNYLVIEKIEWKHDVSAIGGGKALADFVLANGEKVSGAVVASVNSATTSNKGDTAGVADTARVSDSYVNNTAYYKHIFTYSVNADGSYALNAYCTELTEANHNSAPVHFTQGKTSTIFDQVHRVVANNNTKFLVLDANGYTYTLYNGINELPSMTVAEGNLCFLDDGTFATLVVIKTKVLDGNTFIAYVSAQNGYATGYNPVKYRYNVYKLGSTEATDLYATTAGLFTKTVTENGKDVTYDADGFYIITLNAAGMIASVEAPAVNPQLLVEAFTGTSLAPIGKDSVAGKYWVRDAVAAYAGDSVVLKSNNTIDLRVNSNTEVYTVTRTLWYDTVNGAVNTVNTEIVKGDLNTIAKDDEVVVAYTGASNTVDAVASYVYILKTVGDQPVDPVTTGKINYYVTFINAEGTTIATDVLVGTQTVAAGSYPNVNWALVTNLVNGTVPVGTFQLKNAVIPTASYSSFVSANLWNPLVVEAGGTYDLHFTATQLH